MKRKYIDWRPQRHVQALVATAEKIINEYQSQGYTLTLRQLYYQFVARDLIPNSEKSYKNLGQAITNARMAGLLDWTTIEDRNRGHKSYYTNESQLDAIEQTPHGIKLDKWDNQDYYVEVWVEKEALGNVIAKACEPLQVPYMSCKGYLSASEAWRAGQRFERKMSEGKQCVLIHLGDHDPSGIDMTRDNTERLELFDALGVDVRRIALNMNQVRKYNPPENPAKVTDSRFKGYVKLYGQSSWELDALEPSVLVDMITKEVTQLIDYERWEETEHREDELRKPLHRLVEDWESVKEFIENDCQFDAPDALSSPKSSDLDDAVMTNLPAESTARNALSMLKRSRGILGKLGYADHQRELGFVVGELEKSIVRVFKK